MEEKRMMKKVTRQWIIGFLTVLIVCSGCATNKSVDTVFTQGILKDDFGKIQDPSQGKTEFFLSEDLYIKYQRVIRTPDDGKNGVVKIKVDTVERVFSVKKGTPGFVRQGGWQKGHDKTVIRLWFWGKGKKDSDKYLEFEALSGDVADRFTFQTAIYRDEKDKIDIEFSFEKSENILTRSWYRNADGTEEERKPKYKDEVPSRWISFSIESETGRKPYLLCKVAEKQKIDTKAKKAPQS
jgi:hypothetical protein